MASDKLLREHLKASSAQVRAFTSRLQLWLGRSIRQAVHDLKTGQVSGAEAAQVLGSLQDALKASGLRDELEAIHDIYADELRFIADNFAQWTKENAKKNGDRETLFNDVDRDVVEALVTFDVNKIAGKINSYADELSSTLMRAVLTGEEPNVDDIEAVLGDRLSANIETDLNTMLQGFSRSVTAAKAEELGFEYMEYIGPDDAVTRPFCEKLLKEGPVYSIEEIKSMNNEQGLPVLQYGGGYNCRHQWRPVSGG